MPAERTCAQRRTDNDTQVSTHKVKRVEQEEGRKIPPEDGGGDGALRSGLSVGRWVRFDQNAQ